MNFLFMKVDYQEIDSSLQANQDFEKVRLNWYLGRF